MDEPPSLPLFTGPKGPPGFPGLPGMIARNWPSRYCGLYRLQQSQKGLMLLKNSSTSFERRLGLTHFSVQSFQARQPRDRFSQPLGVEGTVAGQSVVIFRRFWAMAASVNS
ncbi:hypothetical protein, partial [Paracoccus ravus]|uniref:hypothetical protein n=1 Tax=Paracoccus ravus TaxID=2447760 RepID=UPI001ADD5D64